MLNPRPSLPCHPNTSRCSTLPQVHARGKTIGKDVDFEKIARRTPGFTGELSEGRGAKLQGLMTAGRHAVKRSRRSSAAGFVQVTTACPVAIMLMFWPCMVFVAPAAGADLANLMNEAAILAARRNLKEISKVGLQAVQSITMWHSYLECSCRRPAWGA